MSNAIPSPLAQAKAVLLNLAETIPTLTSANQMYESARIISVAVTRYLESYTVISTTHHTQLRGPVTYPYARGVPVQMGAPMMAPQGYTPYTNPHQPMYPSTPPFHPNATSGTATYSAVTPNNNQAVHENLPTDHMAGAGGLVASMVSGMLTSTEPGSYSLSVQRKPKNDTAPWVNKKAEKSNPPADTNDVSEADNQSTIADEIKALLLNLVIILDAAVPVQFNPKTLAALDVAAAELLVNMLTVKQALA